MNGKRIQSILSQIYTHIYNRSSNDKTLNGILVEKKRLILVSDKKSDAKRLKYFNEVGDLAIFSYEYKYGACNFSIFSMESGSTATELP